MHCRDRFYNDVDPFTCKWVRNLIRANNLSPGFVAEGDIKTIARGGLLPDMRQVTFHAFAGIGVWDYALQLADWPAHVPVWTGSCPCQPFSVAGRRKGNKDARHLAPDWLKLIQRHKPAIVFGEQVASPDGRDWLDSLSTTLEALGYEVGASDLCSAGVGAPHIRQRLYFVAVTHGERRERLRLQLREWRSREGVPETGGSCSTVGLAVSHESGLQKRVSKRSAPEDEARAVEWETIVAGSGLVRVGDTRRERSGRNPGAILRAQDESTGEWVEFGGELNEPLPANTVAGFWDGCEWVYGRDGKLRPVEPGTFPLADGHSNRVGRIRAYGNAIDPNVARVFIESAMDALIG